MNEEVIPDSQPEYPEPLMKAQNKKYLIRISIFIVVNTILFSIVPLDHRSVYERFLVALPAYLFLLNIIGFILGLGLAMLPFKLLSYKRKYLRASLLSIYIIHIVMFVMVLLAGIPMIYLSSINSNQ